MQDIRTITLSDRDIGLLLDAGGRLSEIDMVINRPSTRPQDNHIQPLIDNINVIYNRWEAANDREQPAT